MMRQVDGETFLTIGEVAKQVGRVTQTLKNWINWYQMQDTETQQRHPLPTPITDLDTKGTRFFREQDVDLFRSFRDQLGENKGMIADISITRWGQRGKEIQRRKEEAAE